jgi:hypothetical protein
MTDSATPSAPRAPRAASKKPRTTAVSTATEDQDKLVRVAQPDQRLAQPSDVPPDDRPSSLIPNDTARAAVAAAGVDLWQGTLTGFELPPVATEEREASVPEVSVPVGIETEAFPHAPRATKADSAWIAAAPPEPEPEPEPRSDAATPSPDAPSAVASAPAPAAPAHVLLPLAPPRERDMAELDRARATALAETVDALYGVIADQRRAASDHPRQTKRALSIMGGALVIAVAVGLAQTVLLMHLSRDFTAQQQRMESEMLGQQAMLSAVLVARAATVGTPAVTPPPVAPPKPAAKPLQHMRKAKHADHRVAPVERKGV